MPTKIVKPKVRKLQNKPDNYRIFEVIEFKSDKFILDTKDELWFGQCLPFSSMDEVETHIKNNILNTELIWKISL